MEAIVDCHACTSHNFFLAEMSEKNPFNSILLGLFLNGVYLYEFST